MSKHSQKTNAQLVAQALQTAGVRNIVISPGSRNAPFIIEFTSQKFFKNYSVIDERAAGFFALGMAQQLQEPVVLVCTSGSAVLNYHPAVAEAFYSHIPLIVISADRPQKWIDNGEGQTIRQDKVLSNHSWYNITLSENDTDTEQNAKDIEKAIQTAFTQRGPVHINVPFDEPLYEFAEKQTCYKFDIKTEIPDTVFDEKFLEKFAHQWQRSTRKMILVGQHQPSEFLQLQLEKFSQDPSVIVLNENISNVQHKGFINNIDQSIFGLKQNELSRLQPEILITVGRNIISKKIKYFLRNHKPNEHWHIEKTALPPNTFEVLSQHFNTSPEMFFSQFLFLNQQPTASDFQQEWLKIKNRNKARHQEFITQAPFSDFRVFELLSRVIPTHYQLQWGNSATVRYAQLFDFDASLTHFSNRGTSGIDGSTATAVGAAFASDKPVLLVTGDISFLYDSNGLWNKYIPKNFKILLVNNGGGDIFNFIPGPAKTEALQEFFVTQHNYKAKELAQMFGFNYLTADDWESLTQNIKTFFDQNNQPQLLEVDTSKLENHKVLKDYFAYLFNNSSK